MPSHNICKLPPAEQVAIEQDKKRWIEANDMTDKMTVEQIKAWLARQVDDELRENFRVRLNVIRNNRRNIKK